MRPRPLTEEDLVAWAHVHPMRVVYAADDPTFEACEALHTLDVEIDGTRSSVAGGTLWLSTWGGLPPHAMEVAP